MKQLDSIDVKRKRISPKAVIAITICFAIILGTVTYDLIRNHSEYEDTIIAMGTVVNVKAIGSGAEQTASDVEEKINEIEDSMLSWRVSGSDINRINTSAGSPVSVSKDTANIISQALSVSDDCNGVFDVTIGKITQLWDFGGDNQRVPSNEEIYSFLPFVGAESVAVSGNTVTIGKNQSLDLGAVGKGAACDMIKSVLSTSKIKSAVISVGGSLLLYGKKAFTIGIVNPADDTKSMGTLKLSDICVSTSGSYEKNFTENSVTYHHILDARTGYPADSNLSSVTVVCSSGLLSDALSTACFILGYEGSIDILNKYKAEAVFIFNDNTVKYTDGLSEKLSITDDNFKVSQ